MYYLVIENHQAGDKEIKQFLLVAGEIRSIFKKAPPSAAMGGCRRNRRFIGYGSSGIVRTYGRNSHQFNG
jgi:hypothetical protein